MEDTLVIKSSPRGMEIVPAPSMLLSPVLFILLNLVDSLDTITHHLVLIISFLSMKQILLYVLPATLLKYPMLPLIFLLCVILILLPLPPLLLPLLLPFPLPLLLHPLLLLPLNLQRPPQYLLPPLLPLPSLLPLCPPAPYCLPFPLNYHLYRNLHPQHQPQSLQNPNLHH